MESATERAVTRVIRSMYENLGEELTIDSMAETAMFSKFHFTRIFKSTTGMSPGRFLSALRLQEAKQLLIRTELKIADISNIVGYRSIGTFSTRFKSSVGLAPTAYRQLGGFADKINVPDNRASHGASSLSVHGRVLPPDDGSAGFVFIGLFPDCIPQGRPVRCTMLDRPGAYVLPNVPEGTWYVLVQSVPYGMEETDGIGTATAPSIGVYGPVTVAPHVLLKPADIQLRAVCAFDPPVLLALLDMRMAALEAVAG